MRGVRILWTRGLTAVAFTVGLLGALAGVAHANAVSTAATFFTATGYERFEPGVHHPVCAMNGAVINGNPGPVFGAGSGGAFANGTYQYVADLGLTHLQLPPGATLVGGTLRGAVRESDAGSVPTGSFPFAVGSEEGLEYGFGFCPSLYDDIIVSVTLPGNTTQAVPFSVDAYAMLQAGLGAGGAPGNGGNLALTGGPWLAPAGAFTLTAQYAFAPAGIAWSQVPACGAAGCGTQFTITWNPDGNGSDVRYILQRATVSAEGGHAAWSTLYQGAATSYTTTHQQCGTGYIYRVAAYGQQGPMVTTNWDDSSELDEYPCRVTATALGPTSLRVRWTPVTPAAIPEVVWCEEDAPSGAVSCQQHAFQLAAGSGQATLSGLTPNAEYAVWSCVATDAWGCPEANVWTLAAAPTLRAVTDPSGVATDAQPLRWDGNGNAPGTIYVVRRELYAPDGAVQSQATVYEGPGQGVVVPQQAGTSATYAVWAESAGYGGAPAVGNTVAVQVASTPTLTALGPTVASVSWSPVWDMDATGVLCEVVGSDDWVTEGIATSQATSFSVTGLRPDTQYTCATYAEATNQGIPWWQGTASVWTAPVAPTDLVAATNPAGVVSPDQPLAWQAGGNPAGVRYVLLQNGAAVYRGTATSFTALQEPGGSYTYVVYAVGPAGATSDASNAVATQVAPVATLAAAGATSVRVRWQPVAGMETAAVVCTPAGSGGSAQASAPAGATSLTLAGLPPNTAVDCTLAATATNQGIPWPIPTSPVDTLAQAPSAVTLGPLGQRTATVRWQSDGNPAGTAYRVQVAPCGALAVAVSPWQTGTSWTATNLAPGTCYRASVRARNGSGVETPAVWSTAADTVPPSPTALTGTAAGTGWSAAAGRGVVTLAWSSVPGATGYEVWVYDGEAYEGFAVGDATTWSSAVARIYPPDASLYPNVAEGSESPPVFVHDGAGLDLRDRPLDLYCTTGSSACNPSASNRYWFTVSAYNASGNSATFQVPGISAPAGDVFAPTLPLQTDPHAPVLTALRVGNANGYAYGPDVTVSLVASEGPSGIAAYALSNDAATWSTTLVSGCTVGQVAACPESLSVQVPWTLPPGPGSRTVYARVESTAGVWSAVAAATAYVEPDQAAPTVDLVLDGGQATTASASVEAATFLTDPLAAQAGLTFRARYSLDGGATWTGWQSEGTATAWSTSLVLPASASGAHTVLEQVEDSDLNVGQAAATIYLLGPSSTRGGGPSGGPTAPPRPCAWRIAAETVSATCVAWSEVQVPVQAPSGTVAMRISLNDVLWGPWLPLSDTIAVDLGASPGAKTVWLEFQDGAGGRTAMPPRYYVFEPTPPTLRARWLGDASATDGAGEATLQLQLGSASPPPQDLWVTVAEDGARLYAGPFANTIQLTLAGAGYQVVQVTLTDPAGQTTQSQLGIFVE